MIGLKTPNEKVGGGVVGRRVTRSSSGRWVFRGGRVLLIERLRAGSRRASADEQAPWVKRRAVPASQSR